MSTCRGLESSVMQSEDVKGMDDERFELWKG